MKWIMIDIYKIFYRMLPNTTIDNKSILIEADNTSVSLITFNPWNHATIDCGNGFK